MTISITASACTYTGDGSTVAFDVKSGADGIYFETSAELYVTIRDGETITAKTIGADYTVSGAGSSAGIVTFGTAPANGVEVRIERRTPLTQSLNLAQAGAFNPANLMAALDKQMRAIQDAYRAVQHTWSGAYSGVPLTLTPSGAAWDGDSKRITSIDDPTDAQDAARKAYVDAAVGAGDAAAAAVSAAEAAASAQSAASSFDSFDDRYLGAKASNPTLDNDGNALVTGALYFNSGAGDMRVWTGAAWAVAYNPSAAVVDSFNGRTGAVSYTAADQASAVYTTTDAASATTTDIGAVATPRIRITGTTTITSFGTEANKLRFVHFADALTLTHHGTTLILPGAANITTAAGDAAIFASDNSGNWRCLSYTRASGVVDLATVAESATGTNTTRAVTPAGLFPAEADIASATTCAIGAATSTNVRVTGTTTITGFGTVASGILRRGRFADALTLTHHGTSLILPGAANITTAAGDTFEALSLGSGNWLVTRYNKADGSAVVSSAGKLVSRAYAEYTANSDLTTVIPLDDTVPTSSEGAEILSVAHTLQSSSNRVRFRVSGFGARAGSSGAGVIALFRGTTCIGVAAVTGVNVDDLFHLGLQVEDEPGSVGPHTYSVRAGPASGTIRLNGISSARRFGGQAKTTLVLEEIMP